MRVTFDLVTTSAPTSVADLQSTVSGGFVTALVAANSDLGAVFAFATIEVQVSEITTTASTTEATTAATTTEGSGETTMAPTTASTTEATTTTPQVQVFSFALVVAGIDLSGLSGTTSVEDAVQGALANLLGVPADAITNVVVTFVTPECPFGVCFSLRRNVHRRAAAEMRVTFDLVTTSATSAPTSVADLQSTVSGGFVTALVAANSYLQEVFATATVEVQVSEITTTTTTAVPTTASTTGATTTEAATAATTTEAATAATTASAATSSTTGAGSGEGSGQ